MDTEENEQMRFRLATEYFKAADLVDLANKALYEANKARYEAWAALEDFEAAQ